MSVGDAPAGVRADRTNRGGNRPTPSRSTGPVHRNAIPRRRLAAAFAAVFAAVPLLLTPVATLAAPRPGAPAPSGTGAGAAVSPRFGDPLTRTGAEELRRARNAFEYGDFEAAVAILDGLGGSGQLVLEQERVEAYRLLGLSLFYLGRRDEAANAFFDLLKQNPDYQLDPFYVPPHAVAFFDDVKKESEPLLAPIRERRTRRIQEERAEEQARQEAERRRQEQLARMAPGEEDDTFVVRLMERRVVENSPLVAWMPFGLGQFQNGHRQLGTALLATEAVAAAVSVLSFWAIEGLRDPRTGQFPAPAHDIATRLDTVKFVSAGIFYGLWLIGAIDANLRFVPTRVVAESPAGSELTGVPGRPVDPEQSPTPPQASTSPRGSPPMPPSTSPQSSTGTRQSSPGRGSPPTRGSNPTRPSTPTRASDPDSVQTPSGSAALKNRRDGTPDTSSILWKPSTPATAPIQFVRAIVPANPEAVPLPAPPHPSNLEGTSMLRWGMQATDAGSQQ